MSSLEKAYDTVACASGMAALSILLELFENGAHFVCSEDLYGGSAVSYTHLDVYKRQGYNCIIK